MNPGALLLLLIGVLSVYIGVKGSQGVVWHALSGQGLPAATKTTSATVVA